MFNLGVHYYSVGDYSTATYWYQRALARYEQTGATSDADDARSALRDTRDAVASRNSPRVNCRTVWHSGGPNENQQYSTYECN